jgi:flagellar motility protein MotE (MotC chaperone)
VSVPANTQLQSPSTPLAMAPTPADGKKVSWMQEMFSYPSNDVTGSIHTTKPAEKQAQDKAEAAAAEKKPVPVEPPPDKGGTVVPMEPVRPASAGERALLERLQQRRQELDARARELDLRETMLKAAEKKLEEQSAAQQTDPAGGSPAKRREEAEMARLKGVVTMYEAMKPKDAAKIFDRLDPKVLLELAGQIKPQQMSAIMAQMSPENAERLTVEMASRNSSDQAMNPSKLPKIDGKPSGG